MTVWSVWKHEHCLSPSSCLSLFPNERSENKEADRACCYQGFLTGGKQYFLAGPLKLFLAICLLQQGCTTAFAPKDGFGRPWHYVTCGSSVCDGTADGELLWKSQRAHLTYNPSLTTGSKLMISGVYSGRFDVVVQMLTQSVGCSVGLRLRQTQWDNRDAPVTTVSTDVFKAAESGTQPHLHQYAASLSSGRNFTFENPRITALDWKTKVRDSIIPMQVSFCLLYESTIPLKILTAELWISV